MARIRAALRRLGETPEFAGEGWSRRWETRRILRFEDPDEAAGIEASGFEVVPAGSDLPRPDTDALDEPPGAERAVCVEDPRCALFVRRDGCVFPCSRLADGGAPLGCLPADSPAEVWDRADSRRFRACFVRRGRARDDAFFRIIGGSRSQYVRSMNIAGADLPPPPPECEGCPRLG